jgi:hypothetical protein
MKGEELERATAAPLQASGWFVLRGATDPTHQAFELDVIGYRFPNGTETSVVLEAKGGKSGFGHLWKLLGLKTHLRIDRGVLLADTADPVHAHKEQTGSEHRISVIDQAATQLRGNLLATEIIDYEPSEEVLAAWQRCFRVEDALIKTLSDKNLWQRYETIRLAKEQLQHLVAKGWMEPDPWKQAVELYNLYTQEPRISRRMAREIDEPNAVTLFERALRYGDAREIQACFYLGHRKRLAVALAATRCAALHDEASLWAAAAPQSFRAIVERIAGDQAWHLPAVLQVYVLGFGGLVRLDDADTEFEQIARQARCSPQQARDALRLFDELFPYPDGGSWFYEGFGLSRLKLMPVALRGAGLWMREALSRREWGQIATAEQSRVAGRNELARAEQAERSILPRHERALRLVRRG